MRRRKSIIRKLDHELDRERYALASFFLGIGTIMLIINIIICIDLSYLGLKDLFISLSGSIFSSILLILYSIYNIYTN